MLDERAQRLFQAHVAGVDEGLERLAATLQIEDWFAAHQYHVGTGGPGGPAAFAVALGPRERRPVRLRGVHGGQDERWRLLSGAGRTSAQALDRSR